MRSQSTSEEGRIWAKQGPWFQADFLSGRPLTCRNAVPIGRLPAMRQQLVNARGRVGLHAEQDVRQVRDRIDAMLLAGCHQSVEHTQINASLFVGHKKKIRPSQS